MAARRVFLCLTVLLVLCGFRDGSPNKFLSKCSAWPADQLHVHQFNTVTLSFKIFKLQLLVFLTIII